jgi:hypothetical protein
MAMRKTRTKTRKTTTRKAATRRTRPVRKVSRPWTRHEMSFMRKYYRKFETAWVARQLGRTVYSVRYKAVDLSITKALPSIWKGNKGTSNAFKLICGGKNWKKPTTRKAASRKSTKTSKTWRASNKRKATRRPIPRKKARRK